MNLKSAVFELAYLYPCRAYSRYVLGDKPADSVYRMLCSLQFWRTHRYWPDFAHPARFTEKLWSRMLHERNSQLTLLCDKLRVRDYVAARIGGQYLVPLLWSGEDPAEIPFDRLPPRFVVKANHGCGLNIFIKDKTKLDQSKARTRAADWLQRNYCNSFMLGIEWGYRNIEPAIIVEEYLEENGQPPVDYKFYCFSGRVEFLTVHYERFIKHKTKSFDRNFEPHEFRYQFEQFAGECRRPPGFEVMVQLAEALAKGHEFMRVDLYNINGRILFGEMTPYPGGVSTRFLPDSLDRALGEKWKAGKLGGQDGP